MAVSTTANQSNKLKTYNVRKLLPYALPKLHFLRFGQHDEVPFREGKTISWVRYTKLTVQSEALASENPTWSPETLADATVSATLELWGNGVEYTEFLEKTTFIDDFPGSVRKLVGQNAGESLNAAVRDIIKAGTNVTYANAKAARNLVTGSDTIDYNDILNAVVTIEENDAQKMTDSGVIAKTAMTDGNDMPADGVYVGFIHPRVKTQLMKDSDFRSAVQHQRTSLFTGHLTTLDGVAHLVTSTAPTVSNSGSNNAVSTLEQTIIHGEGFFGTPAFTPDMMEIVITPPGGHGDEYAVKTAIAWKAYFKPVILNDNWGVRIESAR